MSMPSICHLPLFQAGFKDGFVAGQFIGGHFRFVIDSIHKLLSTNCSDTNLGDAKEVLVHYSYKCERVALTQQEYPATHPTVRPQDEG